MLAPDRRCGQARALLSHCQRGSGLASDVVGSAARRNYRRVCEESHAVRYINNAEVPDRLEWQEVELEKIGEEGATRPSPTASF